LFSIAKKYFDKVNPGGRLWAFKSFYYGPFIPGQKLQEAREEYANYDDEQERPIIYVDNSRVGRMGSIDSSGLMITNRYFYYKLKMKLKDKQFIIGKISSKYFIPLFVVASIYNVPSTYRATVPPTLAISALYPAIAPTAQALPTQVGTTITTVVIVCF
jgi:hypothetical protein